VTGAASADVALIVNPTAGKGRAAKLVASVASRLRDADANVSILIGHDADDALMLARKAVAEGIDALVALGGDGMVNLAINAVAGTSTPLGIVPAGTGNDLAATLELPTNDPVAAARLVARRLAASAGGGEVVRLRPRRGVRLPRQRPRQHHEVAAWPDALQPRDPRRARRVLPTAFPDHDRRRRSLGDRRHDGRGR
jgi:predicted polyphosphate/ATP-dependent NAD kinase